MAKIIEYRDIELDDLVIGRGQVRTSSPGKGIEELAESISVQGLLQPIVVCEARTDGKWEILTGQRRFLAHKMLRKETIPAAVLDHRVDEKEAKAISITENLIRRRLSGRELKDGILYLYNIYGSINDVWEATGIPRSQIRDYVKYPRLLPELKSLVDDGAVNVNAAVKAQDASEDDNGEPDKDVAVRLAKEMEPMTGTQRKNVVRQRKDNPEKPIDDVIETAKTGARVIQIVVTVTQDAHRVIQSFAAEEKVTQDEAAAGLIEEALTGRGLLD
ncbi:MAG: ParB/RepB/Spo0J family partition protein [Gammaproteobacteria bacterium]|nr:ParB/RepB/Spo0J family partition protein [Gammaproteobacteria bacterium]